METPIGEGTVNIDAGDSAAKGNQAEVGDTSRLEAVTVGDLKSTVEFKKVGAQSPKGAEGPEGPEGTLAKGEAEKVAADKVAAETAAKQKLEQEDQTGKPTRAEKRIKQLISERDAREEQHRQAVTAFERRLADLEKRLQGDGEQKETDEFLNLSSEDFLDKFHEKPQEFLAARDRKIAAEVREQILNELNESQTKEQSIATMQRQLKTFEDFGAKHPDFNEMWEDGTIQDFMKENPGHNAISAYREITHETTIKEALKKARADFDKEKKEAVDKALANIQAGIHADMGGGGGGSHAVLSKDGRTWKTSDYGGDRTAALLARLEKRGRA